MLSSRQCRRPFVVTSWRNLEGVGHALSLLLFESATSCHPLSRGLDLSVPGSCDCCHGQQSGVLSLQSLVCSRRPQRLQLGGVCPSVEACSAISRCTMPIVLAAYGAIDIQSSGPGTVAMLRSSHFQRLSRSLCRREAQQSEGRSEMQVIEKIEGRGIAKEMSIVGRCQEHNEHTVKGSDRSSLLKLRTRPRNDLDAEL